MTQFRFSFFILFAAFALSFSLQAQQSIPQAPNKTDAQGLKQGKWAILYDKDWKVISNLRLCSGVGWRGK